MGTLTENLAIAKFAVDRVKNVMTTGASNKATDVLKSAFGSVLCVLALRSVDTATPENDRIPHYIRVAAAKAQQAGCGNCGEQSALALIFLVDLKIKPIDLMKRTNADHVFVVIGRETGSISNDYKTWGPSAVVCDPWDEKSYPAVDIPIKMVGGGKFAPISLYRDS